MEVFLDFNPKKNLCQIVISDEDVKQRLFDAFSIPNDGKKFVKGPQRHWVPDKISFISPTFSFNFGLTERIVNWIQENVHDRAVNYTYSESFCAFFAKDETPYEIQKRLSFEPRPYQEECVKRALYHRNGTFVLGTGAGKTFTIAMILDNLFYYGLIKNAMILVPDNGLVLQFHDELKNQYHFKGKISLFYDKYNTIDPEADIIIANRPLFLTRFHENGVFFKNHVDCLIVDEAHSIKRGNKVSKCIEKMITKYKFGFTGTLAENIEDKMKNLGLLGDIRFEMTSKELRDCGYLSDVQILSLQLKYPYLPTPMTYRDEFLMLQEEPLRNEFLSQLLFSLKNNTLVLVTYLAHGFLLEELLNKYKELIGSKKKVFFIRGEVETEVREEVKKLMEQEDDIVCVAITKIFSTGINIKNLHNIVLAAGGKSSVTVVQSIGRGLRLHPNKKALRIFDLSDIGFKYSMRHAEIRRDIYEEERIDTVIHTIDLQATHQA